MNGDIDKGLLKSIGNNSIKDLSIEAGEIALNSIVESDLIDSIPVLGILNKMYKSGVGISERIFAKKILMFLDELTNLSQKENDKFQNKFLEPGSERQKFGEKLVVLIDKLDDINKSKLIAKAFRLYLNEKIDKNTFFDLCYSIQAIKYHYLKELYLFSIGYPLTNYLKKHFDLCEVCSLSTNAEGNMVSISGVGNILVRELLVFSDEEIKNIFADKIIQIKIDERGIHKKVIDVYGLPKNYSEIEIIAFINTIPVESIVNGVLRHDGYYFKLDNGKVFGIRKNTACFLVMEFNPIYYETISKIQKGH